MICPNCHLGYMEQHPEQPQKWLKCCICAYCILSGDKHTPIIVVDPPTVED